MAFRSIYRVAGMLLLLAVGACAPARPGTSVEQNTQDIFGENIAQYDPGRAFTPLEKIKPAVQRPTPLTYSEESIPPGVVEAIDRAAELRGEKRYTEAVIELERIQRSSPETPSIYRALAITHWLAGNTHRAETYANNTLAQDPGDLVAHYLLARIAAGQFETAEAIRQYRLALLCSDRRDSAPYRKLSQFHLAEALASDGYLSAAVGLYEAFQAGLDRMILDTAESPELSTLVRVLGGSANEQIASIYERLGRLDEAVQHYRAAYTGREMNADARRDFVKLLARAGRYEEAAAEARTLLRTDATAADLLATIYQQEDRSEAIVGDLRELAEAQPENTEAAISYANALERFRRDDEAVAFLQRRMDAEPEEMRLVMALFDLHIVRREWQSALKLASTAIHDHEDWTDAVTEHVETKLATESAAESLTPTAPPAPSDETDFATAYLRGVIAEQTGHADLAKSWLALSIEREPQFVAGRVRLGRLHLAQYEWEQALGVAAPRDLVLTPDTRLELIVGKAYAGLDQDSDAIVHLNVAVRLNRTNTEAMASLADLYLRGGRLESVRRQYEQIVETDPLNAEAHEMLFRMKLAGGDRRAAAAEIEQLEKLAVAPTRIARCVAQLQLDRENPDYAAFRKTLSEAMEAYEPDAETLYLLAESYIDEGRPANAAETLRRALALDSDHQPSGELLVTALYRNLQFEESLEQQRRLLERRPNRLMWRLAVVELLLIVQDYDEALSETHRLLALPDVEERAGDELRRIIVQTHRLRGENDQALVALEKWFAQSPNNADLLRLMILIEQEEDRQDQALVLIKKWLRDFPMRYGYVGDEVVWRNIPQQNRDAVLRIMLDQITDDPDNDTLQLRLVNFLKTIERYDEAIEMARSSSTIQGYGDLYRLELVNIYDAAGRLDDALRTINELMLDTADPHAPTMFAPLDLQQEQIRLLVKAEDFERAIERLNRWIKDASSTDEKVEYLGLLAGVHQSKGDLVEARETLALAHELAPSSVGLNNDLGYTYADAGLRLDEAEQMVRQAVASDPRNGAYLDSYGWVLYKQGRFEEARKWLSMAANTALGEDPVICDHLADVSWRLGETEAARKWWSQAVEYATERIEELPQQPDQSVLDSARAKLEALNTGEEPQVAHVAE